MAQARKAMNAGFAAGNAAFAGPLEAANALFANENSLFDDLGLTGKRIKSMREQLGLTIREWAAQAGIGIASQHEIEQGTCGNKQMVLFSLLVVPKMVVQRSETINGVLREYLSLRRTA